MRVEEVRRQVRVHPRARLCGELRERRVAGGREARMLKQVAPRVPLVRGKGEVERMAFVLRHRLVDRAAGEVEHVARRQHDLGRRRAKLRLRELGRHARARRRRRVGTLVAPPALGALELPHDDLDVVGGPQWMGKTTKAA